MKKSYEDEWKAYQKRTQGYRTYITFDLLHSEAFKALVYAPALKMLMWFLEKRKFKVNKRKKGSEKYEVIRDGEIVFPYREGAFRGLNSHQFSKALRQLHEKGFIEVKMIGSAFDGDTTIYTLSEKWRLYGTRMFQAGEFPRSTFQTGKGFQAGNEEYLKRRDNERYTGK